MTNYYVCRACGSTKTSELGQLPDATHFAGKKLASSLPKSYLYACNSCHMWARHPILTRAEYNQLYANAKANVWSNGKAISRRDQVIVKEIILKRNYTNHIILDVGCYTGDLLASLPNNFTKFGIEASKEATILAVDRGINVIGDDLYQIESLQKFDIITAVDVIEHTENPEIFLNNLISLLTQGGEVIISTGNTDSQFWKKLKNKFWYSRFAEHISFVGEQWLDQYCLEHHLVVSEKLIFRHSPKNIIGASKNFIKKLFLLDYIFPIKFSNTTEDHICFVITNKKHNT